MIYIYIIYPEYNTFIFIHLTGIFPYLLLRARHRVVLEGGDASAVGDAVAVAHQGGEAGGARRVVVGRRVLLGLLTSPDV